jgi:putative transcriptional regulator
MIVNRLSRLLGERRESVAELARESGVSYSAAYHLWKGDTTRIDFDTLNKLCQHFGVTACEILEYVPVD